MDILLKHKDALEAHLFERDRTLFNLDCTITLYDLTNTFFEGTARGIDLAAYGRSKEKRSIYGLRCLPIIGCIPFVYICGMHFIHDS